MIAPTQIMKPKNWQDFEKLCKLLWGEIWNCSDSIKQHGRQGQAQHGVDIYAYVEKYVGYCGIQCKGKDDYTKAQLTEVEIDNEIDKAKTFSPKLKRFIFATTANKDAVIERYIRQKDMECIGQGLFHVDVFSWEDIVDLLERERTVYNWYLNNCQFKEATDVKVVFQNETESCIINPLYLRVTKKYKHKKPEQNQFGINGELLQQLYANTLNVSSIQDVLNPKTKVNKCWCKLSIKIVNVGNTVIKSPKMTVWFREEDIDKISDRFSYMQSSVFHDQNAVATINAERARKREVYQKYSNGVEYKSLDSVFVQKDERCFSISIIPKQGVESFPLFWQFLCEDYSKDGTLTINVLPEYEDVVEVIDVENKDDEREEVFVKPKIIEE